MVRRRVGGALPGGGGRVHQARGGGGPVPRGGPERRFGGDPSIVGQTLTVNAQPRTVIGIMPRGFQFPDEARGLILPFQFERERLALGGFAYRAIARETRTKAHST